MSPIAPRNLRKLLFFLGSITVIPLVSANGALVDRYSLNGDGTESVSGNNGTLANPGNTASFSSTALTTTDANSTDYLSLPSTIGTGVTGDFSVEDWLTQTGTEQGYATIFSLSTSTSNFILLNPNRNGAGMTADFDQPGVTNGSTGTEVNVTTSQPNFKVNGNFNSEVQVVLTYVSSTGLASVYFNNSLVGSGDVGPGFNFQTATAGLYNGIGGGDAFADPTFNGSTDDFRIYSDALTPTQISTLYGDGPNVSTAAINAVVPEPSSLIAMAGVGMLLGGRRLRRRFA